MPKAVTFDVGGTLVDFVDLPAQAWRDAFREHGRDIAFGSVRGQIGKAGLRTVGVPCGGFPEDGLRKAGCTAV